MRCVGELVWQLSGGESRLHPESNRSLLPEVQRGKTPGTREGSDVGMARSYLMPWQRNWPREAMGLQQENICRMDHLRTETKVSIWGGGGEEGSSRKSIS